VLDVTHLEGRQDGLDTKRLVPVGALDRLLPCLEPALLGIGHDQEMHTAAGAAPVPLGGGIEAKVAQAARAVLLRPHAREKLIGEAGDDLVVDAERPQALARERHLQRGGRPRIDLLRSRHRGAQQPAAGGFLIGDLEQEVAGFAHLAVAEAHQALQVAVVDRGRPGGDRRFHAFQGAILQGRCFSPARRVAHERPFTHKRRSHSLASLSVIEGRSMPSRIRLLRSRSTTVRPG
jgi:hypothetical protein